MTQDFDFDKTAEGLRQEGKLKEALLTCLEGISALPEHHRGRLVLARVFYDLGFRPFAVREIETLCRVFPQRESLRRLCLSLEPSVESQAEIAEGTVAEEEINFDDIELLDDKK